MSTTRLTAAERAQQKTRGFGIYIAFLPWVLFTLITQHDSLQAAAIAALGAAVVIALPSLTAGRPKVLELGAILAFAGFTVVAFTADPATSAWVARYARAIAAGVLALISFGSLLLTPFTEQYARESVPRGFWSSPRFKEINRHLTLMWSWVFVAMIPSHLIAGAINTHRANTIFNWVVPIVLIIWAAKRTAALSTSERQAAR
jgi:MFS family permease